MINLKGIPIRLVDTAGIADTKELLEIESVARSKRYLALADIAIAMFDCSRRIDRTDEAVVDIIARKKKVVVLNKCDLVKKISAKNIKNMFREDKVVEISVETRKNIDALEDAIADTVLSGGFTQGESAIVSNARHKELLDRARDNMLSVVKALDKVLPPELIAIDLKEAICCLGLIIGKAVSDDILDRIFDRFCIGK
jgi:tRNA modification GTPase